MLTTIADCDLVNRASLTGFFTSVLIDIFSMSHYVMMNMPNIIRAHYSKYLLSRFQLLIPMKLLEHCTLPP